MSLVLILVVSALGMHALIHWHGQSFDDQHCQVCHIGHVSIPVPAAYLTFHAPLAVARVSPGTASFFLAEQFSEHCSPRAPPA
ncbi:MAG TPA: hypothetical protein VMU43_10055 [Candidatus Acidoferrum sp.]|nr:hypothetical protein [Candidatus Acidoferrum sp.]